MRHVNDGDAIRLQAVQKCEELVNILGGERRARLVENQNSGVAGNRLDNLCELALASAKVAGQRLRVDVDIEVSGDSASNTDSCHQDFRAADDTDNTELYLACALA